MIIKKSKIFFKNLKELNINKKKKERYLTDILNIF